MNRNGGMEWQAQTQFRANEIMKKYWVHTWISYAIVLLDIIFLIYMVVFKMDYRINYIIGGFAELLLIISSICPVWCDCSHCHIGEMAGCGKD